MDKKTEMILALVVIYIVTFTIIISVQKERGKFDYQHGINDEKQQIIQLSKDCKAGEYLYIDGTQTYPCQKTVEDANGKLIEDIYQWKKTCADRKSISLNGKVSYFFSTGLSFYDKNHEVVFDCKEGKIDDSDPFGLITIPAATSSMFTPDTITVKESSEKDTINPAFYCALSAVQDLPQHCFKFKK